MMREKIGAWRSADERDEDRDAERLAYVAKRGVHGGAGREAVGGQTCDRGRSEERHDHRHPDPRPEDGGQPHAEVVGRRAGSRE